MSYKDIGPIALVQPNGRSYIVFDENIRLMQLQNRPPEKRLFGNITQDSKHIYFAEDLSGSRQKSRFKSGKYRSNNPKLQPKA